MKSTIRSFLKPIFFSLLNERSYMFLQALSKTRDILSGVDDEKEISLIPLLVHEGETVIDMGANYALYTYHASKRVGEKGHVYAFEPIPFTYEVCRKIARRLQLKNVHLYQKGCSNTNGKVAFTVPIQNFGAVSAGQSHLAIRNNERPGKEQHFKFSKWKTLHSDVVRLDEFLPGVQDVSLIKADIEGAEYYALQGAEKMITRYHPSILCEINPFFLDGFGIKRTDLISFFLDKGYGFYFFRAVGETGLEEVAAADVVENNYLFIHPERLPRVAHLLRPKVVRGSAV